MIICLGLKKNVKSHLEEFLDLMRPLQLGGKLACLLIQLPPKYTYNPENLEGFFKLLDPNFRYAVEFRNSHGYFLKLGLLSSWRNME